MRKNRIRFSESPTAEKSMLANRLVHHFAQFHDFQQKLMCDLDKIHAITPKIQRFSRFMADYSEKMAKIICPSKKGK